MLLCARGSLNLFKALLFGSTLAGGCPFASFPSLERGTEVCSIHPPERRPPPLPFPRRPRLTCSRAAFIFLDKLPRRRQHFAALVYGFRFEGASAQDFAGLRRNTGNQFAGTPKKYLLCQTFLLSYIRLHPKGCERNKRDAYAETVQRGKPMCYGHADKISPYVYSTRRKNVRYHQNRRQAIQGCRR